MNFIEITYDRNMLTQIERRLGKMKSEAPKALKNAINMTARQVRTDLKKEVRRQYIVKAGEVAKRLTMKRATNSHLEATIFVKGKPVKITNYKTTTPKKGAKAQVLKSGGLKPLVGPKGITAFKGLNGLIWQRRSKERMPIKPLSAVSIPKAVEVRVYDNIEPGIKENLKRNVDAQVKRILGG